MGIQASSPVTGQLHALTLPLPHLLPKDFPNGYAFIQQDLKLSAAVTEQRGDVSQAQVTPASSDSQTSTGASDSQLPGGSSEALRVESDTSAGGLDALTGDAKIELAKAYQERDLLVCHLSQSAGLITASQRND